MKLFQTVQKFFQLLGLSPKSDESYSLNAKNVLVLFIQIEGFVFTAAFGIFQAKTMREYGDSFYQSVTELSAAINLLNFIGQINSLYNFIETFEGIIAKSKSTP